MNYVQWIIGILSGSVLLYGFLLRKTIVSYIRSGYRKESRNHFFKLFNTGTYGEFLTFVELEKIPHYKKILVNSYFPKKDGGTAEIDLILIDPTGIYVIESKNYSGAIYGKDSDFKWTQVLGNQKNLFYNPVRQNHTHVNVLRDTLNLPAGIKIFSLIVFSNRCRLKTQTNTSVMQRKNLIREIHQSCEANPPALNESQIDSLYRRLKPFTQVSRKVKKQHIQRIKSIKN